MASVTSVYAEETAVLFSVSPQKCVTLKQGRVCYLDLDIEWKAPDKSDYCISWKSKKETEKCWKDSNKGDTSIEFAHHEDDWLQLTNKTTGNIIAVTPIVVKWVYKSRQKASVWRVF